jgi:hypothetical protein
VDKTSGASGLAQAGSGGAIFCVWQFAYDGLARNQHKCGWRVNMMASSLSKDRVIE